MPGAALLLSDLRPKDYSALAMFFEDGNITPLAYAALNLLGDRDAIAEINDRRYESEAWNSSSALAALALERHAVDQVRKMSVEAQRATVAYGILGSWRQISNLGQYFASVHFNDTLIGGDNIPHRIVPRVRPDMTMSKNAYRELYSRPVIRRLVENEKEAVVNGRDTRASWSGLAWPKSLSEGKEVAEVMGWVSDELERRVNEAGEASLKELYQKLNIEIKPDRRLKIDKKTRKVLTRAASLATTILGQDCVTKFLRKEGVTIAGTHFDFHIEPGLLARDDGHGAVRIEIREKDRPVKLANSCCYFKDMCALDQLACFALHIQAGDEKAIFDGGNLYNLTSHGFQNDILRKYIALKPLPFDERIRAAMRAYRKKALPIYNATIAAYIWGDRISDVARLSLAMKMDERVAELV